MMLAIEGIGLAISFVVLCWISYERGVCRGRIEEIKTRLESDALVRSVHEETVRRFNGR